MPTAATADAGTFCHTLGKGNKKFRVTYRFGYFILPVSKIVYENCLPHRRTSFVPLRSDLIIKII